MERCVVVALIILGNAIFGHFRSYAQKMEIGPISFDKNFCKIHLIRYNTPCNLRVSVGVLYKLDNRVVELYTVL